MIPQFKNLAGTLALAFALLVSAQAEIVYNQPFDFTGNAFSSQNDTGGSGNFATMYDNFVLDANAAINNVQWLGEYFSPPVQGPITAWTVSFYADNTGQPGALLMQYHMAGTANEAFVGYFDGFPAYKYSFDLGIAFNALAGTQYWLSVVPDLTLPPQWGWSSGVGPDMLSYQDFFGSRYPVDSDMTFTLNAASVPESYAAMLVGATMLFVSILLWRIKSPIA